MSLHRCISVVTGCFVQDMEVLDAKEAEAKLAVKSARRAAATAAKGAARDGKPRYLTPSEVQEVMRRMWAKNAPILALLFAADKSATVRASLLVAQNQGLFVPYAYKA